MPYWYVDATIPISHELIAKLNGEHWVNHPPMAVLPSVKPLLDAIAERREKGLPVWRRPTPDALRAHYGTRKDE